MRSSLVVAVVSVIAISACNDNKAPDGEWKPGAEPMRSTGTSGEAAHGRTSTESAPAGAQPQTSPDTAVAFGTDAVAKPTTSGLGTVAAVQGKPMMVRATRPLDCAVGTALQAGDIVETGSDTKVRINFEDGSVLAIGPRSKVTFKNYSLVGGLRSGAITVAIGAFWMNVTKWANPEQSSIEITTPNAVAGVRGTTLWGDTQRGVICSLDGTVTVSSVSGKMPPATLSGGHCVAELDAVKLTPVEPDAATVQKYLDEVQISQPK